MTGRRLGNYELAQKLGEGGMGVVYAARDLSLGRDAAIKLLLADDAADTGSRRRLMREAKAASALNHPNIVTVYAAGTEDGAHFIAMELVSGETLAQVLGKRKLPVAEALRYATQIAEGLECAHAAGLAHRDLKPSNIMITGNGLVKILDFGLAKLNPEARESDSNSALKTEPLTQPGAMVGTLAYMAPEQARGEDSTPQTDIFSYGVVLYEMLTNKRPFQAKSQIELFHEVLYTIPEAVDKLAAGTPPALAELVEKAMRKKPEERYASMSAVLEQLRLAQRQLDSPPVKVPWTAIAAGAAILTVAASGAYLYRKPPQAASVKAPASAAELVIRGHELLDRKDRKGALDQAVQVFEEAIQKDPQNAAAYAGLADARLSTSGSRPDPVLLRLAEESAKKALELSPELATAHAAMGWYLSQTGKHKEAIESMRKAADLDPKSAEMQWRLAAAMAAAQRGRPREEAAALTKEAEEHYRKGIALEPQRWEAHSRYGTFLAGRGRFAEAAAALEKARDLMPDHFSVHSNLAAVYHMLGRDDDSAAELQRSLEARPTFLAYSNLGTLQYYRGHFTEAASAFEHALELNGADLVVWGNLGDARRWIPAQKARAGEAYARAIQLLNEKIKTSPADLILKSRLAQYLAKSGDNAAAQRLLAELEKQKIADHGALFHTVLAYELTGQRERALAALEKAFEAGHPFREAKSDPELVGLRNDPRYHRMAVIYEAKQN